MPPPAARGRTSLPAPAADADEGMGEFEDTFEDEFDDDDGEVVDAAEDSDDEEMEIDGA
jgi:ribosome assembly protein RRB1